MCSANEDECGTETENPEFELRQEQGIYFFSQVAISPVWPILRRYATEVEEITPFLYYKREETYEFSHNK